MMIFFIGFYNFNPVKIALDFTIGNYATLRVINANLMCHSEML